MHPAGGSTTRPNKALGERRRLSRPVIAHLPSFRKTLAPPGALVPTRGFDPRRAERARLTSLFSGSALVRRPTAPLAPSHAGEHTWEEEWVTSAMASGDRGTACAGCTPRLAPPPTPASTYAAINVVSCLATAAKGNDES